MTQVQHLASVIHNFSDKELAEFREWFENYIEDRLELTDEAQEKIREARDDIAEGRVRTRRPA